MAQGADESRKTAEGISEGSDTQDGVPAPEGSYPASHTSTPSPELSRREFLRKSAVVATALATAPFLATSAQAGERKVVTRVAPLPFRATSRLNDVGRAWGGIPAQEAEGWRSEIRSRRLSKRAEAQRNIWLGEYEVTVTEDLDKAFYYFRRAQQLTTAADPEYGLAAYNEAIATYFDGRYADAAAAFAKLLHQAKPSLRGFPRITAMNWLRHAGICAAEHDRLGRMGIPRPRSLDPLCAVGSLAMCLRALKIPCTKAMMVATVRHTRRGSNAQDIVDACAKLGTVVGRAISLKKPTALIDLPKPLVAHVENDHFVAVLAADKTGVTYSCTDCGPWPGGQVQVTWKQWRAMRPGLLVAVSIKGSAEDKALAMALKESPDAGVHVAAASGTSGSHAAQIALKLSGLVVAQLDLAGGTVCGYSPQSQKCVSGQTDCPTEEVQGCSAKGDPVNLATGEEEYSPDPDIVVYNPVGPDVVFQRLYNNLRGFDITYQNDDLGQGWSHSYNYWVYDSKASSGSLIEVMPGNTIFISDTTITTGPAPTNTWEIVKGSTVIADGASPGGWAAAIVRRTSIQLSVPTGVTLDDDYEVRVAGTDENEEVFVVSAPFAVVSALTAEPQTGSEAPKYVVFPNGARTAFWVTALPTVMTPVVAAQTEPQAHFAVEMCYDSGASSPYYYVITFRDGSRMVTTVALQSVGVQGVIHGLYRIYDKVGNYLSFAYSGWGPMSGLPLLSTISNSSTTLLTFARNGSGNILSLTDCYERMVHYATDFFANANVLTYDPQGFPELTVVSQVVPLGTSSSAAPMRWEYGYTEVQSDHSANGTDWEYVVMLNSISVPSPSGSGVSTTTLGYYLFYGFVGEIVDGQDTIHRFYAVDNDGNAVVPTPMDPYPNMSFNQTKVVVSGNSGYIYAPSRSRIVRYDAQMNPTESMDGSGASVGEIEYSDPGNPTKPTSVTDALGNVTEFQYDSKGNVTQVESPRGAITTFEYDYGVAFPFGRLVSVQQQDALAVTRPATTFEYFEPSGLLKKMTGPVASGGTGVTEFTYDSLGNVLTQSSPGNNASSTLVTVMDYTTDGMYTQSAALGQPLTVTRNVGDTVTPVYSVTHFRYDALGRLIWTQDALGNVSEFTYNIVGQPENIWLPATGQTGSGRNRAYREYVYPDGPLYRTRYYNESGTVVRTLTPDYDTEGEVLTVAGAPEVASFNYARTGLLAERYDGNYSRNNYFAYGVGRGRLNFLAYTGEDQYLNETELSYRQFEYNNADMVTRVLDSPASDPSFLGPSKEVTYTYNTPGSLLTDVGFPDNPSRDIAYVYDDYGRVTQRTDETGTQVYQWGDVDELLSVTTTYKNPAGTGNLPARTISYVYNPDGSRASMTCPAGTFTYLYDAGQRLISLSNPYSETTTWDYLLNGWLNKQIQAGGVETVYTYNALGQLMELTNQLGSGGSAVLLSQFTMPSTSGYDGLGNRLSVTAYVPGVTTLSGTTTYQYDTQSRLTQESSTRNSGYTVGFGYDGAGNLTNFKGASRTYSLGANQRTGTGFDYDVQGCPITYGGVSLTFDEKTQMRSCSSVLTAGYTAEGVRAWKEDGSANRTYFLYDGVIPILEMDGSGTVSAVNTRGASGLASRREVSGTPTSVFYTFDERGNTTQRLDVGGTVLSNRLYDAFGTSTGTPTIPGDPYDGFGGQWGYYTDVETGLILCTYRYYDPLAGRWLTRDPIGYEGGVNLYAYCNNNPIMGVDPLGLQGLPAGCRKLTATESSTIGEALLVLHLIGLEPGNQSDIGIYDKYLAILEKMFREGKIVVDKNVPSYANGEFADDGLMHLPVALFSKSNKKMENLVLIATTLAHEAMHADVTDRLQSQTYPEYNNLPGRKVYHPQSEAAAHQMALNIMNRAVTLGINGSALQNQILVSKDAVAKGGVGY